MIEAEQVGDGISPDGASVEPRLPSSRMLGSQPVDAPIATRDLMVIEVLDRMERLYRDQLSGRDRELTLKDRLLTEFERRADKAEQQVSALQDYISNLPPDDPDQDKLGRSWWRFWE